MLKLRYWFIATLLFFGSSAAFGSDLSDLENAIQTQRWNEAVQISQDMLAKNQNSTTARLRGAYALFQLNLSNSALLMLSQITPQQWRALPEGEARFAEVVTLLQKKVPLNLISVHVNQVNVDSAPVNLSDEIYFNKGREAFELGDAARARGYLTHIPERSLFFADARYILGTIDVQKKQYDAAGSEFSKVFNPSAFEQSSELWRDISSQISSHWGPNVRVSFDTDLIAAAKKAGTLAVLGLARVEYAKKNYKTALEQYAKIPADSIYYPRASLERIWTLLSLNEHDEAEKVASKLTLKDGSFESIEARVVRALVLVDAGQSQASRDQLADFEKTLSSAKKSLADFEASQGVLATLPSFLQTDVDQDQKLSALRKYQGELENELKVLRSEDRRMFPSYTKLATSLEPLLQQTRDLEGKLIAERIRARKSDLDRLATQAQLILVETYLDDREELRVEYRAKKKVTEQEQLEHDLRLADILRKATEVVDKMNPAAQGLTKLAFRQTELLWELGDVETILGQVQKDETKLKLGDQYKYKALQLAQQVLRDNPNLPQVLFFVGFAQTELNQYEQGLVTLKNFVNRFPEHQHAPDAYRILADARFDANDFSGAEAYYKKILQFQNSPVVGYALYKIGWCAYNRKDFAGSLLGLEKAIVWNNQTGKEKALTLQREAEHDLITIYAEVGNHRKAREYFSQFLPGDTNPWLLKLARELDRTGQYEKAGDIYRLLIASQPYSKENVALEASILHGFYQLHRWSQVIDEAKRLDADYKDQLAPPQAADTAAGFAEQVMRDATSAQQFEFKKRPTPEAAARVSELDNLYLTMFGAWPTAQDPLYRHAHFLLGQHQEAEAAKFFERHWKQFGPALKEPLREEALRNLIFALNQAESSAGGKTISDSATKLLEYSSEYEKDYPTSPHARAIAYLRPSIYFKYGLSKEAIEESRKLFDAVPNDEIGQRCFKNLRSKYYELKMWHEAYDWSDRLINSKNPLLTSYLGDLKTIHEETYFLWSQSISDDDQAAAQFLKLADDPTATRLRDKSLYNAFIRKNKAGHKFEALQIANRLEKASPQFDGLSSIAGLRAALYQDAGDYVHAEPLLETFLSHHDASVAPDTVLQAELDAGLIAQALNEPGKAKLHFSNYLKRAPAGEGKKEAMRGLASLSAEKQEPNPVSGARLAAQAAAFERQPIPRGKDLAKRIRQGAATLESLTQKYIQISANAKTPIDAALEYYCRIPLLYEVYQKGLLRLGDAGKMPDADRKELKDELTKVADPVGEKAKDFARECISKSGSAEHDGPMFREVMDSWGWQSDPGNKKKTEELLKRLKTHNPWFDPSLMNASENEILQKHLESGGDEKSWYALAKLRWDEGRHDLSRLTVLDALHRYPNSGPLLNLFAVSQGERVQRVGHLFETAGEKGSAAAWANLAVYHLEGARLEQAIEALRNGLKANAFRETAELRDLAKEVAK